MINARNIYKKVVRNNIPKDKIVELNPYQISKAEVGLWDHPADVFSTEELHEFCVQISKANVNVAEVIADAVIEKWWQLSVGDPCQLIARLFNVDVGVPTAVAKLVIKDLWDDRVFDRYVIILGSCNNNRKLTTIATLEINGAWLYQTSAHKLILSIPEEDRGEAIILLADNDMWDYSLADPCDVLREDQSRYALRNLLIACKKPWWTPPKNQNIFAKIALRFLRMI